MFNLEQIGEDKMPKTKKKAVPEKKIVNSTERKDILKKAFISLLKEQQGKFNKKEYVNAACKGRLRDVMDEHDDHDRKYFDEILNEMSDSGELYHIGGDTYTKVKNK